MESPLSEPAQDDAAGALAWARAQKRAGRWRPEHLEFLMMLMVDPEQRAELLRGIDEAL